MWHVIVGEAFSQDVTFEVWYFFIVVLLLLLLWFLLLSFIAVLWVLVLLQFSCCWWSIQLKHHFPWYFALYRYFPQYFTITMSTSEPTLFFRRKTWFRFLTGCIPFMWCMCDQICFFNMIVGNMTKYSLNSMVGFFSYFHVFSGCLAFLVWKCGSSLEKKKTPKVKREFLKKWKGWQRGTWINWLDRRFWILTLWIMKIMNCWLKHLLWWMDIL